MVVSEGLSTAITAARQEPYNSARTFPSKNIGGDAYVYLSVAI